MRDYRGTHYQFEGIPMTMMALQSNNDKQISNLLRVIVLLLPVIIGFTIVISSEVSCWQSQKYLPRGGYTTIVCAFFAALIDVVPFIVIAIYLASLILRGAGKTELYLKLALMLIQITLVTTYALFTFGDAESLRFLVYFNLALVFAGQLLATRIYKSLRVR